MAAPVTPITPRASGFAPPSMEAAEKAAESARMGTERQRTLELRKVCLAYAMKIAEGKDASSAQIIDDAAKFYAFFAPEDGDG